MVNRIRRNKLRQWGLPGTFLSETGISRIEMRNARLIAAVAVPFLATESPRPGGSQRVEGSSIAATWSRIAVRALASEAPASGVSAVSLCHCPPE